MRCVFHIRSILAVLFTVSALSAAPLYNAGTIIQRSVEANAADWKAAPDYDYFERDQQLGGGTKTYQVLMIWGSPYQRLVAVNGKPVSPELDAEEQQKLDAVIFQRRNESERERDERIVKYQKDRQRDQLMMEQLTQAFDFTLMGEQKLDGHDAYVLKATPRVGYQPPNMETEVLRGMQGRLWIDTETFQWVRGCGSGHTPGFHRRLSGAGGAGDTLRAGEDAGGEWHLASEAFCHEISGQGFLLFHSQVTRGRNLLRVSQGHVGSRSVAVKGLLVLNGPAWGLSQPILISCRRPIMRNPHIWASLILVLMVALWFGTSLVSSAETSKEVAWNLILSGLQSSDSEERVTAVRVLGLLIHDPKAADSAEHALGDSKPEVRGAAATALGQMHSTESIPKLKQVLSDKDVSVALAAARALHEMKEKAGYEVYYEILTGEQKGSEGLIAQQTAILHDPKKLTELGFEQGIGYVPFASMGWDALRVILKNDSSPVRAAAATMLADDPDPASAKALVQATQDKNWIVRVAALEAVAKRGDPALRIKIEPSMYDPKREVRCTAAATVLRLFDVAEAGRVGKGQQAN